MTYDILVSEVSHVTTVMLVALAFILVVCIAISILAYMKPFNSMCYGAPSSISYGGMLAITATALLLVVMVGFVGIITINSMERGFCDIGEHVNTTDEYNTEYHLSFNGTVLEHSGNHKRVVVDRNGTQQTFHIRWLEEVD